MRRFNLRPGDTVTGPIRQPREGERFFALQKVDKVNFADPLSEAARERILFDNLTPLYPTRKLKLEHEAVGDDDAHHRHVLPHRPGPALPHRRAAQGR